MRFPVSITIQPSRRLRAALVFVHLMAIFGLVGVLPPWSVAMAAPVLVLSSWRAYIAVRGIRLTLGRDASVECQIADAAPKPAEFLAESSVFPKVAVLRIRVEGEVTIRTVIVLSDSASAADFRRLQIWMRWVWPFRRRVVAG